MGKIGQYLRQRWTRERFERHTEQFLPTLYRIAQRLTGQQADAEDLVHDTYVKAYQAFDSADLHNPDACRAWLYRILVNTYRDRYRHQQRSLALHISMGNEETPEALAPALASDPAILLERHHFSAAAQAAIATLAPEVRVVVTLFFVEALAYKDIAAIVGCPLGTVMSRLARGRQLLRQRLQAYHDSGEVKHPAPRYRHCPESAPQNGGHS